MEEDSPFRIEGISTGLVDDAQVKVRSDAGGEGSVILDSAAALLQGLFPPTRNHKITLANGTTVVAPLNGYQYVPGTRLLHYMHIINRTHRCLPFYSRECGA